MLGAQNRKLFHQVHPKEFTKRAGCSRGLFCVQACCVQGSDCTVSKICTVVSNEAVARHLGPRATGLACGASRDLQGA